MNGQLVLVDSSVDYRTKEAAVIVAALAWVIALGGVAAFAIMVCGWRNTKSIATDWMRGKVTVVCR